MGTLRVVQGAASFPVRYHADAPAWTGYRRPAPRTTEELVQFLHQDLGLEMARVQHILSDVDRWGSTAMSCALPGECEGLFTLVALSLT